MLFNNDQTIVLLLDGNSEIGVHLISNLCYLISLGHLLWSKEITNWIFFSSKRPILLLACNPCSELLSNIDTMISTLVQKLCQVYFCMIRQCCAAEIWNHVKFLTVKDCEQRPTIRRRFRVPIWYIFCSDLQKFHLDSNIKKKLDHDWSSK